MQTDIEKTLEKATRFDVGDDWFEVLELPNNIFGIIENGHVQEVCSFLIIGSEKALLFDTGMGISDISAVINKLTTLDIIVVNSHSHFDHIGDDWRFHDIHIFADDYAVNVLTKGYSHRDVLYDSDPELFTKDYPVGFDPENYSIKPVEKKNIHLLHNSDIIELGNRQLKVLHTPGHSQDCIMLHDQENRILFTGDTYCEWMFAFFDFKLPKFGESNLEEYAQTMRKLAELVPDLDYLYPSHAQPLADPDALLVAADALDKIISNEAEYYTEELYGNTRRVYEFGNLLIWTS